MGVQDGQERRLEAILRTLWEIVNSVGSGKLTFCQGISKTYDSCDHVGRSCCHLELFEPTILNRVS